MLDNDFNLEAYLTTSVEAIIKEALRATLSNPRESVFMTTFALASKKASQRRQEAASQGEHVPPFLITSITNHCNLHCTGCYSRAINTPSEDIEANYLSASNWAAIFKESSDIGVSFILLAGGETLLRKDVLTAAAAVRDILFPVFTNGLLLDDDYLSLFDKHRNLFPVLSIEGNAATTDQRRGKGIYQSLTKAMASLHKRGILFGTSITVTTRNMQEVTATDFVDDLRQKGCKLLIFVEYVPMVELTKNLALGATERAYMRDQLLLLRSTYPDMVFISFPGDEKSSGGCLAAGRGFFHINAYGGAEPCPFSPFPDVNVKAVGVRGALHSGLFQALQQSGLLLEEHDGGCVLFRKEAEVKALLLSQHA